MITLSILIVIALICALVGCLMGLFSLVGLLASLVIGVLVGALAGYIAGRFMGTETSLPATPFWVCWAALSASFCSAWSASTRPGASVPLSSPSSVPASASGWTISYSKKADFPKLSALCICSPVWESFFVFSP